MAYIGKTPTVGNFQVCDAISVVNNQAAYTMQVGGVNVSPESANHMIVSLNGVIQKPTDAYTVSSSTITFASNLVTGDVIDFIQILGNVLDLGVPSDSTVSLAKLTATGTKDATTFLRGDNTFAEVPAGGITEADQWRLTANSNTGSNATVSSNWERNDTSVFSRIGTGLSESSGIFSFPSTGTYLIIFFGVLRMEGTDTKIEYQLEVTANNSSYNVASISNAGNGSSSDVVHATVSNSFIFNVTNISNYKFKFATGSFNGQTFLLGGTNYNYTGFHCLRLGDST